MPGAYLWDTRPAAAASHSKGPPPKPPSRLPRQLAARVQARQGGGPCPFLGGRRRCSPPSIAAICAFCVTCVTFSEGHGSRNLRDPASSHHRLFARTSDGRSPSHHPPLEDLPASKAAIPSSTVHFQGVLVRPGRSTRVAIVPQGRPLVLDAPSQRRPRRPRNSLPRRRTQPARLGRRVNPCFIQRLKGFALCWR